MAFSKDVLRDAMATADPLICGDKGSELLRAGKAEESVEW
ncbi:unnamed protein product [Sphacelaria rigidula]